MNPYDYFDPEDIWEANMQNMEAQFGGMGFGPRSSGRSGSVEECVRSRRGSDWPIARRSRGFREEPHRTHSGHQRGVQRMPAPRSGVPRTLGEVTALVDRYSDRVDCTCDACRPDLYRICPRHPHMKITIRSASPNRYGKRTIQGRIEDMPRHMESETRGLEAMHLVRQCITSFNRPKDELRDAQIDAIKGFRNFLSRYGPALNERDGRVLPNSRGLQLCQFMSGIFFMNRVPPIDFRWQHNDTCYGVTQVVEEEARITIVMHPTAVDARIFAGHPKQRAMQRLGTILHELCHAMIILWSCESCPLYRDNIGRDGHGRAWQLLAKEIENACPQLLGFEGWLGRFPSLRVNMQCEDYLPSAHDLHVYKLVDRK